MALTYIAEIDGAKKTIEIPDEFINQHVQDRLIKQKAKLEAEHAARVAEIEEEKAALQKKLETGTGGTPPAANPQNDAVLAELKKLTAKQAELEAENKRVALGAKVTETQARLKIKLPAAYITLAAITSEDSDSAIEEKLKASHVKFLQEAKEFAGVTPAPAGSTGNGGGAGSPGDTALLDIMKANPSLHYLMNPQITEEDRMNTLRRMEETGDLAKHIARTNAPKK